MAKNIMILIPTLTDGGAERVAANLSVGLAEAGHNIFMTLFDGKQGSDYPYQGTLINLDLPAKGNYLAKALTFLKRIKKLREIKKKYRIETTISFMEAANHVNLLSKVNDKIIISIRDFFSKNHSGLLKIIYSVFIKAFYNNRADLIITVSEELKQDLIKNYALKSNKLQTIYNGYNIAAISAKSQEKPDEMFQELFNNHNVLITAGRLDPKKGQASLIRIFAQYKKNSSEKLVILGDGELHDRLITLATNLGLKTWSFRHDQPLTTNYQLYLIGYQSNPFKYLARAKLYLFPSLWEGFPNALAEAMICGLPVISADCSSGPREILAPQSKDVTQKTNVAEETPYGWLLPTFDIKWREAAIPLTDTEKLWLTTIEKLTKNQTDLKHLGGKVHKRMVEFGQDSVTTKWLQLI